MSMERHLIAVFAPFGLLSLLRGGATLVAGGGWSCRCSQLAPLATHCCQHPTHQSWANPPWPDPSRRPPCSHPRMLGVSEFDSENGFGEGGHVGRPADQRAYGQGTGQPRTTHHNGHCEQLCEGWGLGGLAWHRAGHPCPATIYWATL